MAEEQLYTWTPGQFRAHEVLVAHPPGYRLLEDGEAVPLCACGADITGTHADHVIDELGRAGVALVLRPRQHGTIDQLVRDAEQSPPQVAEQIARGLRTRDL